MTIMTQGPDVAPAKSISPSAAASRRWWRRPWVGPLVAVAVAFIAYSVPPYLTFDPSRSRIPPPEGFAPYYPLLVAHVLFGSVAMLTCCVQIWPSFRRRYPAAHRTIGRVYVLGGVVPAGLLGLTIGAVGPFGPVIRASNIVLATVWVAVTLAGFRAARRGRLVAHRRWMVRSFALTLSVITNRVWAVLAVVVFLPQLPTTFGGNETMMIWTIAGLSGWLGWVLPLLFVEWWLEGRPTARQAA